MSYSHGLAYFDYHDVIIFIHPADRTSRNYLSSFQISQLAIAVSIVIGDTQQEETLTAT